MLELDIGSSEDPVQLSPLLKDVRLCWPSQPAAA